MNDKIKNIVLTAVMAGFMTVLTLLCWLKPQTDYSDSERRELSRLPDISAEAILSGSFMSDFEAYTLDQFPFRDSFRALKSVSALYGLCQLDNNDIYIINGYASKLEYPLNAYMIDNAADKFRWLYDTYMADKDMNLYYSVIPDKNYFLAADNGYLSIDYDKLIESLQTQIDFMEYIDIIDLLSIEDYYRTDTHWRQENIIDIAERLADRMGTYIYGKYTENTLSHPFYGVYYGQSALPLTPDTIKYLNNDTLDKCIVTSLSNGTPVKQPMYSMDKAYGKDAYEMFLSGSEAILTIENPNAATDKELIVFRDSFGSSLAPLLADGYSKITLVDIRYVKSSYLGNIISFENQDVLFLYSTLVLNDSVILN